MKTLTIILALTVSIAQAGEEGRVMKMIRKREELKQELAKIDRELRKERDKVIPKQWKLMEDLAEAETRLKWWDDRLKCEFKQIQGRFYAEVTNISKVKVTEIRIFPKAFDAQGKEVELGPTQKIAELAPGQKATVAWNQPMAVKALPGWWVVFHEEDLQNSTRIRPDMYERAESLRNEIKKMSGGKDF